LVASVMVPVNAARSAWAKQQLSPRIHAIKRFFAIVFLLECETADTRSARGLERFSSTQLLDETRLNHANLKTTLRKRGVTEYSTDIVRMLSKMPRCTPPCR